MKGAFGMDRLKSYRDLLKEIELWEIRLWDLKNERRVLLKRMLKPPEMKLCASYDFMPRGGAEILNFPDAWNRVQELDRKIEECETVLAQKKEAKARMEKVISEFDSLEYQVAYKRDIEGKPLYIVAEELGMSYPWIRKISMRVKRLKAEKIPS